MDFVVFPRWPFVRRVVITTDQQLAREASDALALSTVVFNTRWGMVEAITRMLNDPDGWNTDIEARDIRQVRYAIDRFVRRKMAEGGT